VGEGAAGDLARCLLSDGGEDPRHQLRRIPGAGACQTVSVGPYCGDDTVVFGQHEETQGADDDETCRVRNTPPAQVI
jgi:hypothetical protein